MSAGALEDGAAAEVGGGWNHINGNMDEIKREILSIEQKLSFSIRWKIDSMFML